MKNKTKTFFMIFLFCCFWILGLFFCYAFVQDIHEKDSTTRMVAFLIVSLPMSLVWYRIVFLYLASRPKEEKQ